MLQKGNKMCLENKLASLLDENIGKLLLRLTLGVLMLFHGMQKLKMGAEGMKGLLINAGFPEMLVYGVYLGEVIAPIFIILGLRTRVSAVVYSFTMAFAIYLAHSKEIFILNAKTGGLAIELPLLFFLSALSLVFLGAGKYSFDAKASSKCIFSKR